MRPTRIPTVVLKQTAQTRNRRVMH
jgi:hypothetical protein